MDPKPSIPRTNILRSSKAWKLFPWQVLPTLRRHSTSSLGRTGSPTQLAQWGPGNASRCFGSSPTGAWLPRPHVICFDSWKFTSNVEFAGKLMVLGVPFQHFGQACWLLKGPAGEGLNSWIPQKNGDMVIMVSPWWQSCQVAPVAESSSSPVMVKSLPNHVDAKIILQSRQCFDANSQVP